MAGDKYDFIQEILQDKKLTPAQRERVLTLANQEIRKDNEMGRKLEIRVKRLEEKIDHELKMEMVPIATLFEDFPMLQPLRHDSTSTAPQQSHLVLPTFIPSKNLWNFLYDYNQNPVLKTTCHEIDSNELENILEFCNIQNYDFEKHKEIVQETYRTQFWDNKKYFVDYKIKNLILVYLTGKTYDGDVSEGWTDEKIKYNWASKELSEWCKKYSTLIPFPNEGLASKQANDGMELEKPFETNLLTKGNKIRYFSQILLHFKHLFHIRSDNSLRDIIENRNALFQFDQNIVFEIEDEFFPRNIEIFTNVEKLIQAYKVLIDLIIEVATKNKLNKPILKLKLYETEKGKEFSIHHKNSVFQKSIRDTIDRKGSTFTNLIKNQLNGMCEFYLRADFGSGKFAEINVWDGKTSKDQRLETFEGVEYILKFNKK